MNQPKRTMNARKRASRTASPRTYLVMFLCGAILLAGFFLAARQHFSSMDYGMKNSRLRKQVDDLETEKRRLLLAREVSLSPAEIKKVAKKIGMNDPASQGEMAQVVSATKEKALPPQVSDSRSMVVKTVSVSPVPQRTEVAYRKIEKTEKADRTIKKAPASAE